MARQLNFTEVPASQAGLSAITFLLCVFALFMCASHSRKWHHWSAWFSSHGHEPVIQLNNEASMLTTGVHGDQSMFSGEQPVWQKNILMGGKCQLPDFSGVIIYDSNGEIVRPAKNPTPLLTWK